MFTSLEKNQPVGDWNIQIFEIHADIPNKQLLKYDRQKYLKGCV